MYFAFLCRRRAATARCRYPLSMHTYAPVTVQFLTLPAGLLPLTTNTPPCCVFHGGKSRRPGSCQGGWYLFPHARTEPDPPSQTPTLISPLQYKFVRLPPFTRNLERVVFLCVYLFLLTYHIYHAFWDLAYCTYFLCDSPVLAPKGRLGDDVVYIFWPKNPR